MALSTYAELKTAIEDWLAEEALLTTRSADFITFLESELNNDRDFRTREMNVVKTAILTADDAYVALPDDFLAMRYIEEQGNSTHPPLTYLTPSALAAKEDSVGYLRYFTIVNGQIKVAAAPDGGEVLEMSYYQKIPALSDSNTTNWLLARSPQLYLYGSLIHAEPFLENDARVATWKVFYEDAKTKLLGADEQAVTSAGALEIQLPEKVA